MTDVDERLRALGLALPAASTPPGAFCGAIRFGNTVTVSGQVPLRDGAVLMTGHLGAGISLDQGCEAARCALLNALATVEDRLAHFRILCLPWQVLPVSCAESCPAI